MFDEVLQRFFSLTRFSVGSDPSRRSDLQILGFCLLHWLTGSLPWKGLVNNPTLVQEAKNRWNFTFYLCLVARLLYFGSIFVLLLFPLTPSRLIDGLPNSVCCLSKGGVSTGEGVLLEREVQQTQAALSGNPCG